MHQAMKGKQRCFGMKARIGADADTWGDRGYTGVAKRREHEGRSVKWQIAERRSATKKRPEGRLQRLTEELETLQARLRALVEHPFRVLKRQFGYTSERYRGMAKNAAVGIAKRGNPF